MSSRDKVWIYLMEMADRRWGCHQMPERSFFIGKYQCPICARCTGVLLGYILSIVLFSHITLSICLVFAMVMLLDWSLQHFNVLQSTNLRRLITGILGGIGCMSMLIKLMILIVRIITQA